MRSVLRNDYCRVVTRIMKIAIDCNHHNRKRSQGRLFPWIGYHKTHMPVNGWRRTLYPLQYFFAGGCEGGNSSPCDMPKLSTELAAAAFPVLFFPFPLSSPKLANIIVSGDNSVAQVDDSRKEQLWHSSRTASGDAQVQIRKGSTARHSVSSHKQDDRNPRRMGALCLWIFSVKRLSGVS